MALSGLLPDAPEVPNATQTAAAQTGTNVSTAIANSYLGNVNQTTPTGNLTYKVNDTYTYTDPTTNQTFTIPRWTAEQTYTPTGQATLDQTSQAELNLAKMANQQSASLGNLLSTPFDTSSITTQAGDVSLYDKAGEPIWWINQTPDYQSGYASGGDITRSYGPQDNFSADRQRVETALMERLNPQLELENDRVRQRLSDQGIRAGAGMDAYDAGMDVYNRQANDARLAVIGQAGQEQQRLSEMAHNQALFQNQAQAQAEQQNAARAAFFNQSVDSTFNQAAQRSNFYNQAMNQQLARQSSIFNAQNTARNQALQEAYQQRMEPINEITALMSGSQVSAPNFISAQRATIPTTDVAGLINQQFAQANDIYKTQTGLWGDIIGGTLGLGGQVARANPGFLSDRRAKEEIEPMGAVFGNGKKLPIYEYQYKGDPSETRHTGPMAQDVEQLDPSAVTEIGGLKHIKLDRMGSIFGRG